MTNDQVSIVIGSLLGDGTISKCRYGDGFFHKKQTAKNLDYLKWHFEVLRPWSSRIENLTTRLGDKVHFQKRYATRSDPIFTALRKEWYPNGHKIVPSNIKLDPLSLAIWFCDDGCNDVVRRSIRFAAQAFTPDECALLASELGKLGLIASISQGPVIRISSRSYMSMLEIVSPYVRLWKCFSYKIDLRQYSAPSRTELSKEDREEICKRYSNGETQAELAKAFNKSLGPISNCLRDRFSNNGLALNNTSGAKWVVWDKERGKWKASQRVDGRKIYLGRFSSKDAAIRAQIKAKKLEF
jgi:hypothetical protein